jgi:Na+/H+ antiporter NhaD/arsenite permease-like protein
MDLEGGSLLNTHYHCNLANINSMTHGSPSCPPALRSCYCTFLTAVIGVFSAIIDNVPLVAATMGKNTHPYPLKDFDDNVTRLDRPLLLLLYPLCTLLFFPHCSFFFSSSFLFIAIYSTGMYPVADLPMDSPLWQLIAFCAGTGGSLLVIGSAAGVALMGLEKVDFVWYGMS